MFTGIVTDVGKVRNAEQRGDLRLTIATAFDPATIDLGASIACSGVCLTVVDKGEDWFAVDVSAETQSCTAPDLWREGAALNLERAMRLGDELGGHIVTGHVDGLAILVDSQTEGDSLRLTLRAPGNLAKMIAAKGSVTLDGVSLTVNAVRDTAEGCDFTVNIIPHTGAHTSLGDSPPGRHYNVEIDVLARYLARMLAARAS